MEHNPKKEVVVIFGISESGKSSASYQLWRWYSERPEIQMSFLTQEGCGNALAANISETLISRTKIVVEVSDLSQDLIAYLITLSQQDVSVHFVLMDRKPTSCDYSFPDLLSEQKKTLDDYIGQRAKFLELLQELKDSYYFSSCSIFSQEKFSNGGAAPQVAAYHIATHVFGLEI